jgi:hypothetical protein
VTASAASVAGAASATSALKKPASIRTASSARSAAPVSLFMFSDKLLDDRKMRRSPPAP